MRLFRVVVRSFLASSMLLVVFAPPVSAFTDVPDTHRHAQAINRLAQLGVVNGRDDGTFGPDDPVYRAQFAKMICGLLEIGVSEEDDFGPFVDLGPDDPADFYPHEFVGAAYQAGITQGKTPTTFAPYTNISLAQVVSMVVRAADVHYPGFLASPPGDWFGWWDDTEPDHGANIRRADYTDLLAFVPIEGPAAGIWRPATRAQVCQILFNLWEKHEEGHVSVSLEGRILDLTRPVHVANNRYYLPLTELIQSMGGTTDTSGGDVTVEVNDMRIRLDPTGLSGTVNDQPYTLRQRALILNGVTYVSLFDLHKMLRLKVDWDEDSQVLGLFWNRDTIVENKQPLGGRPALVRFEDITASQKYSSAESLEKLRIMFDHCFASGIPMHLSWVPRYIDTQNGIDNAPAEDYSMHNANFIYTIDYFVDRNGLVGLHGYTHQYEDVLSLTVAEFDGEHNTSEESIRERVRWAIDDANLLGIPITFFESPHYASLFYQKKILAEYFDILYEPEVGGCEYKVCRMEVGDRVVKWVPTPLGYINGPGHGDLMIERIQALDDEVLASFFYHPYVEFGFITVERGEDGYPWYSYDDGSPLRSVVDALLQEEYTFVDVTSL